ncbi:ubiquitin-like-specific protease ESD4 [Impatiens glandulifera]|uniref:ubiquitin-like-specific protease ESD4 n=1 Tax=Impatiens glandulifera TaxID=253017 RepID=UPI001FB0BD61|nr:ubiquitin-like-specific protease ESD4 [Impatiens glandulifera]
MIELMGAFTSNRKRGDYCTSSIKSPFDFADTHIVKKPKLSSPFLLHNSDQLFLPKTSPLRIYRYPEPVNRLKREVHAPCRTSRYGFHHSSKLESRGSSSGLTHKVDVTENVLRSNYDRSKIDALQSLRYLRKDKEVIDIDDETVKDDVFEDSKVDEVQVVKDGGERRLGISEQDNGVKPIIHLLDEKTLDENLNLKVESAENLMQSLSIDRDLDGSLIPFHKKLLDTAEKRNRRLSSLSVQIEDHESLRAKLQLLRPVKKVEQEEEIITCTIREAFVPLTKEEEAEVQAALSSSNRRNVLVIHASNNVITGDILQCLRPEKWLNDEVINLYLELLKEREKREPGKFLKCHFFNTFFYKKLANARTSSDLKSLGRWTTQRKLGYQLVDCDKIFVPVHKEIHWCLAVINKKDQKFQYIDSLGGTDSQVLKKLAKYYVDEVKEKSGQVIDVSKWQKEFVKNHPAQENGYDCGMFMIKYVDFYSRDLGLSFKQEHMPYFRLRTVKEILRLKAE